MLLIICVERLLQIGSHFSLRKWRQWPHFPTKLAAVASFSYKIGGGGFIFLQNWQRRQGHGLDIIYWAQMAGILIDILFVIILFIYYLFQSTVVSYRLYFDDR